MAQAFRMTFKPDAKMMRTFKRLPEDMRRRIGRKSLKRAALHLVDEVKAEMEVKGVRRTGRGIASIGHALQLNRIYKDELHAIVGPVEPDGWYLHFREFGTGPRKTSKGKETGMVPAKPFMEPAFNRAAPEMQTIVAETIREELAKPR